MIEQKLMQCEKCNVEVKEHSWFLHLKGKTHLENDPQQTIKPFRRTKFCEKCNVQVRPVAWNCSSKR